VKTLKKKGFTLVEILLYISISAVMLGAISFFFFLTLQSRAKSEVAAEVEQQGVQVMQLITQTIRNAEAIILPSQGTPASLLYLNIPDTVNDIFFNINLGNGAIQVTENPNPAVPLTPPNIIVSNLSFTNLSRPGTPGTIRIQFTLSSSNPEGKQEYEYSKTFYASASLRP
jgi:type II secretory pathway pseudopilin PulG